LIQGGSFSVATEGVIFGINHTGVQSNWWYGSGPLVGGPWSSDGVWYWLTSDAQGAGAGDYREFTGNGPLPNTGFTAVLAKTWPSFTNVFKNTPGPYTSLITGGGGPGRGVPANGSPVLSYDASTWSDVEIKQVQKVVTLNINRSQV